MSLAQRLIRDDLREIRLFAVAPLSRALPDDPERSWQLIRRLGRTATDWISVDAIADLVAQGVLLEAFRWAELELLVYSQSPWERRLVGSTLARLPYQWPAYRRRGLDAAPALTLIKSLIGDADPNVQKALSWALRSWAHVDEDAVTELLYAEAATAIREGDGHRAWVIRDTLPDLPDVVARDLRDRLSRVRRRHDAPSTSEAATAVAGFGALTGLSDTVVGEQGERMARIGR